jgi:polar amino acid transport system permease protein
MFASCADPSSLEGLNWLLCYLTTGKHLLFYTSFLVVLLLMAITAPVALAFGFGGALAARAGFWPLRMMALPSTSTVTRRMTRSMWASEAQGEPVFSG